MKRETLGEIAVAAWFLGMLTTAVGGAIILSFLVGDNKSLPDTIVFLWPLAVVAASCLWFVFKFKKTVTKLSKRFCKDDVQKIIDNKKIIIKTQEHINVN